MYHIFLTPVCVDGPLGWFHIEVDVDSAAINMEVQLPRSVVLNFDSSGAHLLETIIRQEHPGERNFETEFDRGGS